MHTEPLNIDVQKVIDAGPLHPKLSLQRICRVLALVGFTVLIVGMIIGNPQHVWGVYYVNTLYWMGLAAGAVMTTVIMQIVRAKWSPPVRRLAEANIAYLPWAFFFLLFSFLGKEVLFPWARGEMPGREWWMEPGFAYTRNVLSFLLLYLLMLRFVSWSLRGDIGVARDKASTKDHWRGWIYAKLSKDWKGAEEEVIPLQRKMSYLAPVIVVVYALVYTFFTTEMVVGMDTIWFSNMFGGFQFLGNIFMGWAFTALLAIYCAKNYPAYDKTLQRRQTWDLGMLMLGFSMLWAYTFFAQFLPQWYSNMPEETQWLIQRTRIAPWKHVGWLTFTCCFIIPFVMLLSEDIKKNPKTLSIVAVIAMIGLWLEKYVIVMPQLFPNSVPLALFDVIVTLGFAGLYGLCILSFLKRYPFIPVSHPLTFGSNRW